MRTHKGLFRPLYPAKYVGNVKQIVYRSQWECSFMSRIDKDSNVLAWASEPFAIPYHDKTTDKQRRYFPDFLLKCRKQDGSVETLLIEIKPAGQSPLHTSLERGKKSQKQFITEVMRLENNRSKWEAARRYAAAHGMRFLVLTEKELFQKR